VTLESVARTAVEKDVIINTIYCTWSGAVAGEVLAGRTWRRGPRDDSPRST